MSENLEPTPIYDQLMAEYEQVESRQKRSFNFAVVAALAREDVATGKVDQVVNDYLARKMEAKRIRENFRERLFPVRRVPSFIEVAGPEAATEYYEERKSLEDQAAARSRARNKRPRI